MSMSQIAAAVAVVTTSDSREPYEVAIARQVSSLKKRKAWLKYAEERARGLSLAERIKLFFGGHLPLLGDGLVPENPNLRVSVVMFRCSDCREIAADYPYGIPDRPDGQYFYCLICAERTVTDYECHSGSGGFEDHT